MTTQQKRTKLQKKCDKKYQEIGRMLYSECLICGGEYSCLHHYYPKSTCAALRYNLKNGIPICVKCHCRLHSSDDPTINNAILRKMGFIWLDELETIKRNTFIKTSLTYYEAVLENLNRIEPLKLK